MFYPNVIGGFGCFNCNYQEKCKEGGDEHYLLQHNGGDADDLNQAMQKANDNTKERQKATKKGDCFWQDTEYGFKVYGVVLKNAYREKHIGNYRFCKCYSETCPDGEIGNGM